MTVIDVARFNEPAVPRIVHQIGLRRNLEPADIPAIAASSSARNLHELDSRAKWWQSVIVSGIVNGNDHTRFPSDFEPSRR